MPRVERQFQGLILQLLRDLLRDRPELPFDPYPSQEVGDGDRPDILLRRKRSQRWVALLELKDPEATDGRTPYSAKAVDQADRACAHRGIRYFAIWNLLEAVLWDRQTGRGLYDSDLRHFTVLDVGVVRAYKASLQVSDQLRDRLLAFLIQLLEQLRDLLEGRPTPAVPLDHRFVLRLTALLNGFLPFVAEDLKSVYERDGRLRAAIPRWVVGKQYWTWEGTPDTLPEEIERLGRLSLLYLLDKLMFYQAMQASGNWPRLPQLRLPDDLSDPQVLKRHLWEDYFTPAVRTVDYETVFGEREELLDELPFLSGAVIEFVQEFLQASALYEFAHIPHDVIGRIFEGLIREEERHKLGQYFTRLDVVDLILAFCVRTGWEVILDPGCGSGTFTVRAYERKRHLTGRSHWDLLDELWALDIAPYPVHLATLNLAIRDLRLKRNYPKVLHTDFFQIRPGQTRHRLRTPEGDVVKVPVPIVDVVVGNPPYTRQEEMEDLFAGLKARAWTLTKREWGYDVSKRSGIYAYFFYHGGAFLKERGRLGFVTSSNWLEVDYGTDLERFFLDQFKLIAIIDSQVERWFPDALVNTAVTVVERCQDQEARRDNLVKFVLLKQPLAELLQVWPPDQLARRIEEASVPEDTPLYRMIPVRQAELWEEGLDDQGRFVGAKWQWYLRGPEVLSAILQRGYGRWTRLGRVADLEYGTKTGANTFFFVQDVTEQLEEHALRNMFRMTHRELKRRRLRVVRDGQGALNLLEGDFLQPVLKSPREASRLVLKPDEVSDLLVVIAPGSKSQLRGTKALSYIARGERQGLHQRPTCRGRRPWWNLAGHPPRLIWPELMMNRFFILDNQEASARISDKFVGLYPKGDPQLLHALLNSTLTWAFAELQGRTYGGGALDLKVYELRTLRVLDPNQLPKGAIQRIIKAASQVSQRLLHTAEEEFSLEDRRGLDEAVLEVLGFAQSEERRRILEALYEAVVTMVRARAQRAQSAREAGRRRTNPHALAVQLAHEFQQLRSSSLPTLATFHQLRAIIEARTPSRKLRQRLLSLVWQELFGEESSLPGEQLPLLR